VIQAKAIGGMETMNNSFNIKQAKEDMDFGKIKELLAQTTWAKRRNDEKILKSIENSICYGAFTNEDNIQIGFARVITDYATTYYICDVIVDEQYRGIGIGKALIETITTDSRLQDMLGMLLTKDAHGLYQQYGFKQGNGSFMSKRIKAHRSLDQNKAR
jgi:N-acetylglutamate synthase-like GNAT family acetyltransferase